MGESRGHSPALTPAGVSPTLEFSNAGGGSIHDAWPLSRHISVGVAKEGFEGQPGCLGRGHHYLGAGV